jgi:hypothetical protein
VNTKHITLISAITALSLTTGCATITRGSSDTLNINSSPAGANVTLSNGMMGRTPVSFKLDRNKPITVEISKAGYETVSANITPQISGAGGVGMAGNVLFGGIIGGAVDIASGAMYDLQPNPLHVVLSADATAD